MTELTLNEVALLKEQMGFADLETRLHEIEAENKAMKAAQGFQIFRGQGEGCFRQVHALVSLDWQPLQQGREGSGIAESRKENERASNRARNTRFISTPISR
jgi:hypothetical protein